MKFLVKKIIMVYYSTKYWNLDVLFDDGKWKQFFKIPYGSLDLALEVENTK